MFGYFKRKRELKRTAEMERWKRRLCQVGRGFNIQDRQYQMEVLGAALQRCLAYEDAADQRIMETIWLAEIAGRVLSGERFTASDTALTHGIKSCAEYHLGLYGEGSK